MSPVDAPSPVPGPGPGILEDRGVPSWVTELLQRWPVGRLATLDGHGDIRVVPICFVVADGQLLSAVDHKPKRTGQLRRLDDIRTTGRATVLIDHYDDDWTQLWWVRVRGAATVLPAGSEGALAAARNLAGKYRQYAERPPVGDALGLALDELRWWRWDESPASLNPE